MNPGAEMAAEMAVRTAVAEVAPKPMVESLRWTVQCELWENRSIWIAPVAMAALLVFGFTVSMLRHPEMLAFVMQMDPASQKQAMAAPLGFVSAVVMLTSFFVAVFYCLDALYGERRDRSILFWKSMPVSDGTTVLAKATIPMLVLPVVTLAVIVAAHALLLLVSGLVILAHGVNPGVLWRHVPLGQLEVVLVYGLIVTALWYAPIYGWLLLISGWVKRAPLLWAVMPWFAAGVLEKVAFHTNYVGHMLRERFWGFLAAAFVSTGQRAGGDVPHQQGFIPMASIAPGHFLMTPGLWIGLVFAAGFFVAAVRMRRYRSPL